MKLFKKVTASIIALSIAALPSVGAFAQDAEKNEEAVKEEIRQLYAASVEMYEEETAEARVQCIYAQDENYNYVVRIIMDEKYEDIAENPQIKLICTKEAEEAEETEAEESAESETEEKTKETDTETEEPEVGETEDEAEETEGEEAEVEETEYTFDKETIGINEKTDEHTMELMVNISTEMGEPKQLTVCSDTVVDSKGNGNSEMAFKEFEYESVHIDLNASDTIFLYVIV